MTAQLPNFVVLGAPKCGTTSLYYYLRQHPQVYLPERKELHYFSYELLRRIAGGPGDQHALSMMCATLDEYAAFYRDVAGEAAIGDISPSYFYFTEVARDIHDRLGGPRAIVMLRDPVQKAFSQYMHLVRDDRETLSFAAGLDAEQERVSRGYSAMWRYAESSLFTARVRHFLDVFSPERTRIVFFDDLQRDPAGVVRGVFEFLGVDPSVPVAVDATFNRSGLPRSKWVARLISRPNPVTKAARALLPLALTQRIRDVMQRANTGDKLKLDDASRARLEAYFDPDTAALEALLGRPVPWGSRVRTRPVAAPR